MRPTSFQNHVADARRSAYASSSAANEHTSNYERLSETFLSKILHSEHKQSLSHQSMREDVSGIFVLRTSEYTKV